MPHKARVFDCFLFFNELELLEIRLHMLQEVVDVFVVVEATKTFSGEEKPLFYSQHLDRFRDFSPKIRHIVIDTFPDVQSAWDMEAFQRNQIARAWYDCVHDDVLIISDVDEIPKPEVIKQYKTGQYPSSPAKLYLDFYYYYLNYLNLIPVKIHCTRIFRFHWFQSAGKTLHDIRFDKKQTEIKDAGWHFSYLGGLERIKYKIQSFSHQEFNNADYLNDSIEDKIVKGYDLFNRPDYRFAPIALKSPRFPDYLVANQSQYAHLIYPAGDSVRFMINRCYAALFIACKKMIAFVVTISKFILPAGMRYTIKKALYRIGLKV